MVGVGVGECCGLTQQAAMHHTAAVSLFLARIGDRITKVKVREHRVEIKTFS